jgi:PadR family transcriptional regulator PadR
LLVARSGRASKQTLRLLAALNAEATTWHYRYALRRETGLQSGTLYPILMRLEERGWLETQWKTAPEVAWKRGGRPPRHMYRLTAIGRDAVSIPSVLDEEEMNVADLA